MYRRPGMGDVPKVVAAMVLAIIVIVAYFTATQGWFEGLGDMFFNMIKTGEASTGGTP